VSTVEDRAYQREAIEALHDGWRSGKRALAVVLPTGTGKTTVFSLLAARFLDEHPGKRVLVLAHTEELITQATLRLRGIVTGKRVGIVKAHLNQPTAHVVVASVATLRNAKRRNQIRNVGLVICDETHRAAASTYQAIFEHYGVIGPDGEQAPADGALLAGFTATFVRSDKRKLGDTFEDVVYTKSIEWAIRNGFLINFRGKRVIVPDLDLKRVGTRGGDFKDAELAEELERSLAPQVVAEAYIEHAADRKGIGFAPTVESAHLYADAFRELGISTEVVSGRTPDAERRLIVKKLKSGEIRVVWNCAVFTEGFDEPSISVVIMGRPTRSAGLYVQMAGRGGRPDKESGVPVRDQDCLLLDVTGVSRDMSLRAWIDLSSSPEVVGQHEELETLLDAEELLDEIEERQASESDEPEEYIGVTEVVDFDPIARSEYSWMRTDGGTLFLPAQFAYLVLVPGQHQLSGADATEPEPTWDVMFLSKDVLSPIGGEQAGLLFAGAWSIEEAMSRAEQALEEPGGERFGSLNTGKKASWRRVREISAAQVRHLSRLGIAEKLVAGMTKGQVSDLIEQRKATQRIDFIMSMISTTNPS